MSEPDFRSPTASMRRQQTALNWLQHKWEGSHNCPICRSNTWATTDVQQLMPYGGGGIVIGGPVVPVFLVVCSNCGFTHMFSALVAGVIEPREPSPTPADEEPLQ